jgi:hypothetical protein
MKTMRKGLLVSFAVAMSVPIVGRCHAQPPVVSQPGAEKLQFDVASVRRDKSAALKASSNVPLGPGGVSRPSGGILNPKHFGLLLC